MGAKCHVFFILERNVAWRNLVSDISWGAMFRSENLCDHLDEQYTERKDTINKSVV